RVETLQGEPLTHPSRSAGRGRRHLEVVDLLQDGLAGALRIVLVRWPAGPVTGRSDTFHRDELFRWKRRRRAEVVELPAGRTRAAKLDGHRLDRTIGRWKSGRGSSARQRRGAPATGGEPCVGARRRRT